MKELEAASMEIGKIMYEEAAKKSAGGAGPSAEGGAGGQGGAGSDVVDAEFKVKD
jgi:hypothetical protein